MSAKKEVLKFFTLILQEYNEDGLLEATKVPARKGKSLYDSVHPVFENYNISFENHSLFLGSSNTPLPLNEDTYSYRGLTLYVRENEKFRIISFMRNDSRKSPTSVSKRFSQLLDGYEVDDFEVNKTDGIQKNDKFVVDDSWKSVITDDESMPYRQRMQQEAIWELFTTEVSYLRDLLVIIEVFKKCFKMLQYGGYLADVDEDLIFANIEEIYEVNVEFWKKLKKVIEKVKLTRQPISPSQLVQSFENFEIFFHPYILFCNTDTTNNRPDFPPSTNEMIKKFITWCDDHERCKRITLAGFIIKPLQRITKYSLLIKAISNKTDDEAEKSIIEDIRSRVDSFVWKINFTLHLRKEREKLNNVINRLSDYCPVEPINDEVEKIIREYCNFDLNVGMPGLAENENRFLLKEGPMKWVGKQGKKEVYVFLFSDMILFTKSKKEKGNDRYRIIHQPYILNRVVLRHLKDQEQFLFLYLNEYDVVDNAFIIQVNLDTSDDWWTAIEETKNKYENVLRENNLRSKSKNETTAPPAAPATLPIEFENKHLGSVHKNSFRRNSLIPSIPQNITESTMTDKTNDDEKRQVLYDWDNGLTLAALMIFIAINLTISTFL